MVFGLITKKKHSSVQVNYWIHVKEIKPCPPSRSSKPVQAVLLQWENGDQSSGSLASGVADGKVEFNEAFKLSVTLRQEGYRKSTANDSFQKNYLEFYLYETGKGKAVKGQILGSAAVNLADYGIIKEAIAISTQINLKKSSRNVAQPVLYLIIEPLYKDGSSQSPKGSLLKESSLDKDGGKSLTNEGNGEECTIASYTDDDDGSSHSSWTNSSALETTISSPAQSYKNGSESAKDGMEKVNQEPSLPSSVVPAKQEVNPAVETQKYNKNDPEEATTSNSYVSLMKDQEKKEQEENERDNQIVEEKKNEINIAKDVHNSCMETMKGFSDSNAELVSKLEMLEEELREAAAVEVGLYSVVAEHGSSTNKVHAPARRLSRFYLHACKTRSQAKTASAAMAAISGLVLVSKACGNDVPRLTFWLSNSVVLRAIVGQSTGKLQFSDGTCTKHNGDQNGTEEKFSPKQHESSHDEKVKCNSMKIPDDWEDPLTFIVALEKLESWIFSRIIESVWWQTLTPHMQSAAAKGSRLWKTYGSRHELGNLEQGIFSIELWKKAFKDACERICPTRAGGHECGCLCVLSKMVMEQLVGRLDVAMLNAILRESADEMPTDPVSDPISDSKVLPIPAGKSSFGAGVQLKNAVGNWSRWLTDLFGIEDNDMNEVCDEESIEHETSIKPFPLLNALSDLMMLPFEMLGDSSTRKEVCHTLSVPLIKRVLNNFVPDEFNPDPIPDAVFETLESEDLCEAEEESFSSFPCMASPIIYSPPPAASLTSITGEVGSLTLQRSGSSVLKKSYTSDDELDSLASAAPNWMPKAIGGRKVFRYQLLREAWRDGE